MGTICQCLSLSSSAVVGNCHKLPERCLKNKRWQDSILELGHLSASYDVVYLAHRVRDRGVAGGIAEGDPGKISSSEDLRSVL